MSSFLAAHGYDPGPTQRPFTAGAIAGMVATSPAVLVLYLLGSLASKRAFWLAGDRDHRRRMPRDGASGSALCAPAGPGRERRSRRMAVRHGFRVRFVGGRRGVRAAAGRRWRASGRAAGHRASSCRSSFGGAVSERSCPSFIGGFASRSTSRALPKVSDHPSPPPAPRSTEAALSGSSLCSGQVAAVQMRRE